MGLLAPLITFNLFGIEIKPKVEITPKTEYAAKIKKILSPNLFVVKAMGKTKVVKLVGVRNFTDFENDCGNISILEYLENHQMEYLYGKGLKYGKKIKIKEVERKGHLIMGFMLINGEDLTIEIIKDGYACPNWNEINKVKDEKWRMKVAKVFLTAKKEKRGLWKETYEILNCLCKY